MNAPETLLAEVVGEVAPSGPILSVEAEIQAALSGVVRVDGWTRFAYAGRAAAAWPAEGRWEGAAIALPKGREAFELALNAAAARLGPEAPIWLAGHNDEGIRPLEKRLAESFSSVELVDARRHCRVLRLTGPRRAWRGALSDHRQVLTADLPGWPGATWLSYPGLFAHGRLDAGTAILLQAFRPDAHRPRRVLDYGAGTGIISLFLRHHWPDAAFDLLDVDALALAAGAENLPGARIFLGDGWSAAPSGESWDLVVSNPPFHTGHAQDRGLIQAFVEGLVGRVAPGGQAVLVTQRQVPVADALAAIGPPEIVADRGGFRVWRAIRA